MTGNSNRVHTIRKLYHAPFVVPHQQYGTACRMTLELHHLSLSFEADSKGTICHGFPLMQIKHLQQIENALACAVSRTPKHSHITPALKSLHWLKIEQWIHYKIISITHNLLHSSEPQYLRS